MVLSSIVVWFFRNLLSLLLKNKFGIYERPYKINVIPVIQIPASRLNIATIAMTSIRIKNHFLPMDFKITVNFSGILIISVEQLLDIILCY